MGQFVHADVSNIDIEERSKKVAVYENELKVERIVFWGRVEAAGKEFAARPRPSTFYHRDFHAP